MSCELKALSCQLFFSLLIAHCSLLFVPLLYQLLVMPVINSITIRKKLESDTIKLGKQAKPMLGKNVEITIREIDDPKPTERKWRFPGSINLGGELDSINIRDFAHDD